MIHQFFCVFELDKCIGRDVPDPYKIIFHVDTISRRGCYDFPMQTLRAVIGETHGQGKAIAHFNMSDSNQLEAIAQASRETMMPVIVGLSEGEREFFPLSHTRALINEYNKEGVLLYLNADHTYSIEKAKAAIDAGVDSIVIDGAKLSFEDNVAYASEVVVYARASGRDVVLEGELGYIGSSSKVMDALPEGAAVTEELMTKPEEIKTFVERTHVDMMAPAVGNVHGIVRGGDPKLSIERIAILAQAAGVPLVLHGGSGNKNEEFTEAVKAGIAIIHINTELRLAYRTGLEDSLKANPDEVAPYKILNPAIAHMVDFLVARIRLFAGQ